MNHRQTTFLALTMADPGFLEKRGGLRVPENWDKISKYSNKDYTCYAGANDWENTWTAVCFQKDEWAGKRKRIWVSLKPAGDGGGKEKWTKWGEEQAAKWYSAAKAKRDARNDGDYNASFTDEDFLSTIKELGDAVKDSGIERTFWKDEKSAATNTWTGMAMDMLPGVGTYRQGTRALSDFSNGKFWSGAGNALGAASTLLPGAGLGLKAGLKGVGALGSKFMPSVASGVSKLTGAVAKGLPTFTGAANKATQAIGKAVTPFDSTSLGTKGIGKALVNNPGKTQLGLGAAGMGAKAVGESAAGTIAGQSNNYAEVLQNITRQPQSVNPIWQSPNPNPIGG